MKSPDYVCSEKELALLKEYNRQRSIKGCARQVSEAMAALTSGYPFIPSERKALLARIAHPNDSVAKIAHELGMTKASYWSCLRRAMERPW